MELHNLDLSNVRRVLRPIRSKLMALSKDLELPSTNAPSSLHPDKNGLFKRTTKGSHAAAVKKTYQTLGRSKRSGNFKNSDAVAQQQPSTPVAISNSLLNSCNVPLQHASSLSTPLRRHSVYLKHCFKEALAKFTHLSDSAGGVCSLGRLSSYVVGMQIEDFEEFADQEDLYECVPAHMRR
jgi:hypothetical protein